MTFSLRPRSVSREPLMLASVRTRVVSWKLAAEMKLSVESDALVMPRSRLPADGRTAALDQHTLVLVVEAEAIDLLLEEEGGVADIFNLHPAEHLPDDGFDVLVRDGHALETVDFLDFIDEVHLQLALAEDFENVMRVAGAVDESVAGAEALAFLDVDVDAAGDRVFLFLAVVRGDVHLALTLGDFTEANDAVNLGDDGGVAGLACLKELDGRGADRR